MFSTTSRYLRPLRGHGLRRKREAMQVAVRGLALLCAVLCCTWATSCRQHDPTEWSSQTSARAKHVAEEVIWRYAGDPALSSEGGGGLADLVTFNPASRRDVERVLATFVEIDCAGVTWRAYDADGYRVIESKVPVLLDGRLYEKALYTTSRRPLPPLSRETAHASTEQEWR